MAKSKTVTPSRAAQLTVRKARFLKRLRESGNVTQSARLAGLASTTLYRHRTTIASFGAAWDAALAESVDALEAALMERALNGVEKPILYGGEVKVTVRTYSDALGMFMLKSKRPEIFDRPRGAERDPSELGEDEARAEVERRFALLRVPPRDDVA